MLEDNAPKMDSEDMNGSKPENKGCGSNTIKLESEIEPQKMDTADTNDSNVVSGKEEPTIKEEEGEKEEEPVKAKHPYEDELNAFKPNSWQYEKREPQMYVPLKEGKFSYVDSQTLLDEMMVKLKAVKELAIDLEHHSYRSYHGIVCLIQISTRSEDFVIDSVLLKEQLHVLNDVCMDTNILKVLHGSARDVTWLQRDLGVFLINMFDTQVAVRTLKEEGANLARILKTHCNVIVNKKYQIADWRVRPLPEDMIKYAREDTHYLLYIYDKYHNLLLEAGDETKNLLNDVYTQSTELCKLLYVFQPDSYLRAYKKCKGTLDKQQLECFQLLHEWRNTVALEKDESTGYTLPNKMMFQISKVMPRTTQGVLSCCHPVPPLVQQHIDDVHKLILQAIKNVPVATEVDGDEASKVTKEKERQLAIQNSKDSKKNMKYLINRKPPTCVLCGKRGHWATYCVEKRGHIGSLKPRGGPSQRGPSVPYGGYPTGVSNSYGGYPTGVSNRGGGNPWKMNGRGYQMQPYNVHPYANAAPRRGNVMPGADRFNMRGNPYGRGMTPHGAVQNIDNFGRGMNYFNVRPRGGPRGPFPRFPQW